MKKRYNVAVIGVGSVGIEMLRVLKERKFPIENLKLLARSKRRMTLDNEDYLVKEVSISEFEGIDIALFAGTEGEKGAAVTFAKEAIKRGAIVIDNGADFRMDPDVPLVVPEVNPQDLKNHKGLIANPNCSTIQMVVALAPLHRVFKIRRIIVSTYQAVSGAGRSAIEQLRKESEERLFKQGQGVQLKTQDRVLPQRIAFNIFPHIGKFEELGYTSEEWKMVRETHKIMHDDNIRINATAVRVPVFNGHSESIYIETEKPISSDAAVKILLKAPGIRLINDTSSHRYPMPIDADGKDDVFVGRVRGEPFVKNALNMWVVSDNLRKGAALNAVQIAEGVIAKAQ